MLDTPPLEQVRQKLRDLDRDRTDQHRLSFLVPLDDVLDHRRVL